MNKEQYLRELEEEEDKKNMFKFPENPHINGVVIENKEPNSPTNNAETNN